MVQIEVTGSHMRRWVTRLLVFVAVVALAFVVAQCVRTLLQDPVTDRLDGSRYQSVTLSNGSLFFGNLESAGGGFYELRDAYLIREQAADEKGGAASREVEPVGQEFLKAENDLVLNGDEIVSVQDLTKGSPVAEAIDRLER